MWSPSDRIKRRIGLSCVVLVVAAFGYGSFRQTDAAAKRLDAQRRDTLVEQVELAAERARAVFREDDGRLSRLRLEIRSEIPWSADHLARDGVLWIDPEASRFPGETDARRLHGLLRRALDDWPSAHALELLVAAEDGIWTHRVERRRDGGMAEPVAKRTPQTLWYAPSVQKAIAAAGRLTAAGEIRWEPSQPDAKAEQPIGRRSIALQNPGAVTQGVLVASLEGRQWATSLAATGSESVQIDLQTGDGRSLRDGTTPRTEDASPTEATASVVATDSSTPDGTESASESAPVGASIVRSGEAYEIIQPLTHNAAEGESNDLQAPLRIVGRASIPAQGWLAWWQSDFRWGAAALLCLVALYEAIRRWSEGQRVVRYEAIQTAAGKLGSGTQAEADDPEDQPHLEAATFSLRDWLSDLRSCLERDAAEQERQLTMRCERAAAEEIASDAVQLGGLLVALGREALARTTGDGVAMEVSEEAGAGIRIEIAAGETTIRPAPAVRKLAASLGAHFVPCEAGRVALTVPLDSAAR